MTHFDELIKKYAINNAELIELKKICDADNKEIKKMFEDLGETSREVDGFVAKIVTTTKEDFDEEKLISILKELGNTEIIKTKEVVDMDALEDAIYNGRIDAKSLVPAKNTSTYKRLTIKKSKEKKNAEED